MTATTDFEHTTAAMPVTGASRRSYQAWDLPVRLCHWIIVLSFLFLCISGTMILYDKAMGLAGAAKIMMKTVHVYAGYVLAIALLLRIIWGFVGAPQARWSRILPFGRGYVRELLQYIGDSRRGIARPYIGHNPLGRLMVTALILLLIAQVGTGLVVAGADIFAWPFGSSIRSWIAAKGVDPLSLVPGDMKGVDAAAYKEMRAWRANFRIPHEWIFYAFLPLIGLHVAGVIWTEIRERVALVSAMITGRKQIDGRPADIET